MTPEDILEFRNSLDQIKSDVGETKNDVKAIKANKISYKTELQSVRKDVQNPKTTVTKMKREIDKLKNAERVNNLLFFGLEDSETRNENFQEYILEIIRSIINDFPAAELMSTKHLGETIGSRPVLVTFKQNKWKRLLFKNTNRLRERKIFIANDLTREQRAEKKLLVELMPSLRNKMLHPKLRDDGIVINGTLYSREQLLEGFLQVPDDGEAMQIDGPSLKEGAKGRHRKTFQTFSQTPQEEPG